MANIIRYRLRTDTAANWGSSDPVLLSGEPGFDSTAGRLKWGDGTTAWSSLPYIGPQMVNDLTTGGTDKVLTAEQGKVLKGLVEAAATTGGGIEEAPEDGNIYARGDKTWYQIKDGYVIKYPVYPHLPVSAGPNWKILTLPNADPISHLVYDPKGQKHYMVANLGIIDSQRQWRIHSYAPLSTSAWTSQTFSVTTGIWIDNICVTTDTDRVSPVVLTFGNNKNTQWGVGLGMPDKTADTSFDMFSDGGIVCYSPKLRRFVWIGRRTTDENAGAHKESDVFIYNAPMTYTEDEPVHALFDVCNKSMDIVTRISDVCWSEQLEIFVAVGPYVINNTGGAVLLCHTSYDGVNWGFPKAVESSSSVHDPYLAATSVCWCDSLGVFLLATFRNMYVSSNGVDWQILNTLDNTPMTDVNGFHHVRWAQDRKVACVVRGNGTAEISADLYNWTTTTFPYGAITTHQTQNQLIWSSVLQKFMFASPSNNAVYTLDVE